MPRWRSTLLLALLAGAAHAAAPQDTLNAVESDLANSKQRAAQLADTLETQRKDLAALSARAAALAATLHTTEARVAAAEEKTEKSEAERDARQTEFNARKTQFAHTLINLVALHRLPPTAMFANAEQLQIMLKTASTLEHTNRALAARTAELKAQMQRLNDARTRAAQQRETLDKARRQLATDQETLSAELAARQRAHAALATDKARAEARVAELSRQSKSLQELITKLERQPVFGRARGRHSVADARATQGALRVPVIGEWLHGFGERKSENETYRGVVLKARKGGAVVAPYAGEVVFTGPFRDYGRMVLIKHAGGLISLLAGLGGIDVGLNQTVGMGEPVGTMPKTASPRLYVELREGSKPVDPADWFANLPTKPPVKR